MRFFGLGMPELIVILLVILVIFGPKNLPKLGSALGKAVKGVREGVDGMNQELDATKAGVASAAATATAQTPAPVTAVVEDVSAAPAATAPAATPAEQQAANQQ
jgi:sec-independent protein translocase protein TatA